jgi:4-diphosphocytidyl-2-C-methyl-D-erythritol kinase
LNKINPSPVSIEELCKIGLGIGADIPFCVVGGAVRCLGVGEVFMPSASLDPSLYVVIAKGKQGSNTAEAYRAIDGIANRRLREFPKAFFNVASIGKEQLSCGVYNAFEQVVLPKNKDASAIKRSLFVLGASASIMSGSGSAVFGIFDNQNKADSAVSYLKDKGYFACVCRPVESLI